MSDYADEIAARIAKGSFTVRDGDVEECSIGYILAALAAAAREGYALGYGAAS